MIEVELEHVGSQIRATVQVENIKDEFWRRGLGGSSKNIRVVEQLYTYSRTEDGVPVFRYRRSREIERSCV